MTNEEQDKYFQHYFDQLRGRNADNAFHSLIDTDGWIIPRLIAAYEVEKDVKVRTEIVRIVSEYRRSETLEFLTSALKDAECRIWENALDGVVGIITPEAIQALRLFQADDPVKRKWIEEAIGQMEEELPDEQQIRNVIALWMSATAAGDLDTILDLMSEEVVFFLPGQEPMRGQEAFAAGFRAALQHFRLEGVSDIQEIRVSGDLAYCWNHLSMTMTPLQSGESKKRVGNILSVFRREADGKWRLFRDANLLT